MEKVKVQIDWLNDSEWTVNAKHTDSAEEYHNAQFPCGLTQQVETKDMESKLIRMNINFNTSEIVEYKS